METAVGDVRACSTDHSEIIRRELEADHRALIVVDIQDKLLPPIFQKEALVRNARILIRLAGILKIPTVMTTQVCQGTGKSES